MAIGDERVITNAGHNSRSQVRRAPGWAVRVALGCFVALSASCGGRTIPVALAPATPVAPVPAQIPERPSTPRSPATGAPQPQPAPQIEVAPREILVRFAAGLSDSDISQEIGRLQAEVLRALPALRVYRLRIPADQTVADFLAAHEDNPALQRIEANPLVRVFQTPQPPNDPYFESQWGLRRIGVPEAWQVTTGRPEVVIAVIDTGVDLTHPDLATQLVPGQNILTPDLPPQDDHGHGTAMAGIIGAAMNNGVGVAGVCPDCRIMPIKALDADGAGTYADVMEGIVYASDHGARVVNLSVGGSVYSDALRDAVDYARMAGAVVVAAAGNSGTDAPMYPAAYPGVLGVAAIDRDDTVWPYSNHGAHVSLAAPGVNIATTGIDGAHLNVTGTSPATALVSGAAGLVLAASPGLANTLVEGALTASADDRGEPGRDTAYGFGFLAVAAALERDVAPTHDITVTGITFGSASFVAGQTVTTTVTIRNGGTITERNLVVALKANGVEIGAGLIVDEIAAGESRTLAFDLDAARRSDAIDAYCGGVRHNCFRHTIHDFYRASAVAGGGRRRGDRAIQRQVATFGL